MCNTWHIAGAESVLVDRLTTAVSGRPVECSGIRGPQWACVGARGGEQWATRLGLACGRPCVEGCEGPEDMVRGDTSGLRGGAAATAALAGPYAKPSC